MTSARAFWIWTIVQYLVTGRFGWEAWLSGTGANKQTIGLWPLVSAALSPKPTSGGTQWFDGFEYVPATGTIQLTNEQVIYCWRPNIKDWRLPETVLTVATFPVFIARQVDKYMYNLLKNDLVATTMVIAPPFEEDEERRAWEDQFLAEYTGVDRAGGTIFGEAEADEDDPQGKPLVQVERLAASVLDSGLRQAQQDAENTICIAFGVPRSLIGDASQRTYANASSEYKNFWTLTVLDLIAEMQEHVNQALAPRIGDEVGWFDLSRVSAVQPPSIFQPPAITDVIETGVANAAQIANVLGIPAADATGDSDTDTVEIGEEDSASSAGGAGASGGGRFLSKEELMYRAFQIPTLARWLDEAQMRKQAPINTWTLDGRRKPWKPMEAERINLKPVKLEERKPKALSVGGAGIEKARAIEARVSGIRALMTADKTTQTVHSQLSDVYPQSTLKWVDDADWSGPKDVPLDSIDMGRRPGGRDQAKVAGIAKGILAGSPGAMQPVKLVKAPGSDQLKVADGYHRTLAHKRLGHDTVPAYVGEVDDDEGPWDTEMHDKKLNRAIDSLSEQEMNELDALGDELALEVV